MEKNDQPVKWVTAEKGIFNLRFEIFDWSLAEMRASPSSVALALAEVRASQSSVALALAEVRASWSSVALALAEVKATQSSVALAQAMANLKSQISNGKWQAIR